ncbi:hypothetical protein SUGI_0663800 [Cryptomeria japonica]|nr:hypothetical protein SUGI_0663800 [Cryptomeria japonica]
MCRTRMGKHRKWQDIMVLEVQDGGEGLCHFCSRDIQWTPICVENDSMTDLCVAIPLGRLDAFMRGESLREGVETQFLQKRHTKHDSALHNSIQQRCIAEDNRKKLPNKKRAQTYQKKRGCTCHFIVKVLYGRPDVAILIFKKPLHVDKNGEACHGVDDTSNELHSQFAPNLFDECKAYIERMLLMDVSVDAIMDIHLDDPIFHDMLKKRDSFVTRKDVINAVTRQPQGADRPFIMGIQMAWMLDMMQSGVPFAWAVTSRNKIEDIQVWLMELRRRGKEKRPDWRINAFIMDDASAKIQAIE